LSLHVALQFYAAVTIGDHEAIPVRPTRVGWVVAQVVAPQHFGDLGHPHRHARMAGIRLLHGIHRQGANGVAQVLARCTRMAGLGLLFHCIHPLVDLSRLNCAVDRLLAQLHHAPNVGEGKCLSPPQCFRAARHFAESRLDFLPIAHRHRRRFPTTFARSHRSWTNPPGPSWNDEATPNRCHMLDLNQKFRSIGADTCYTRLISLRASRRLGITASTSKPSTGSPWLYPDTMTIKAIIFDVDGTLADTEDAHRIAFNKAFAENQLSWNWDVALY